MVDITLATREKSKLRIALAGVSGGGKTLGALLLAAGLTGGDFPRYASLIPSTGAAFCTQTAAIWASGSFITSS